jgi:tetratricopeptide (TPR) repeat protein
MSERQRTEAAAPLRDAAREARIEQLLVSGLDQYFAGQYEQAINIWTRVIFLERGHNRARAYIERARGALAERQRESEELLHDGVEAYNAGRLDTARDLLTRAVAQGGPSDTALTFLDRLSRADGPAAVERTAPGSARPGGAAAATPRPTRWVSTLAMAGVVVAVVLAGTLWAVSWFTDTAGASTAMQGVQVEPLPVVRSAEVALSRARALFTEGRSQEALALLDAIPSSDPLGPDADRLRGEVQRQLLAAAAGPAGVRP